MRLLSEPEFGCRRGQHGGKNSTVCGRNDQIVPGWRPPFRVAKKRNDPQHHRQSNPARPSRENKENHICESSDTDERPTRPMKDELSQIVTCVPISTTRLGGSR